MLDSEGVVTVAAEATSATPSVDEKIIERLLSHRLNGGGDGVSRPTRWGSSRHIQPCS